MLETLGIILLTSAGVCGIFYTLRLQGKLSESQSVVGELYTQVIESERSEARTRQELDFLKTTVTTLAQRTVVAAMSDTQMQNITSALLTYASSLNKPMEEQN